MRAVLAVAALVAGGCLDYDALSHGSPDLAGADFAPADAAGDLSTANDLAVGDLAVGDLAVADFAGVDFAAPPDLRSTDLALGPVCGALPGTCSFSVGLAMCDDFESGARFASNWQGPQIIPMSTGTVGTDSLQFCRGADALHITTAGGSDVASLLSFAFSTTGPTFVRAYVNFAAAPSETELFDLWGVNNDRGGLGVHNGQWTWLWNAAATASASSPAIPTGQWLCVELEVQPGTTGQGHVWINDVAIAALDVSKTNVSQPNRVQLGLTPITSQPAGDVWFNELAVDTAYIPCSR